MLVSRWLILAIASVATTLPAVAAFNSETGDYAFQRYTAKQYGASPQNWAITQDKRGVIYFANTYGLLEFDGNVWRRLALPRNAVVRSVSVDNQGIVYVGGAGELGFLKPDSTGTMQFVSLIPRVPQKERDFADVWRILPTPQGVYFSALNRLLRVNNDGKIKTWRPQKRFGRAFYVLNGLYVQTAGTGLMRMGRDDRLAPVTGGERFATDTVNAAIPFRDGALITTSSHLYRLTTAGIEPFPTAADPYFATSLAYSMRMLPDGEIAVGTRKGGLVLLNPTGSVDRTLSTTEGLADDYVSDIHVDPQGGVWLAQNNGITRFNPGLSTYGKSEGLEGDIQSMTRAAGVFYAGTTAGLFQMKPKEGARPQFERVDGVTGAVFALLPYQQKVLAGTDQGVFAVAGKQALKVFEGTRTVFDSSVSLRDPDRGYLASQRAVTVLEHHGMKWLAAAEFQAPGEEFRTVREGDDGRVWATTKGGVWRLDFRQRPVSVEKFGEKEGIPAGWVSARRLSHGGPAGERAPVIFATAKGIKRFDEKSKSFVPYTSFGSQFADGSRDVIDIFDDARGDVWITGETYQGVLRPARGGYKWLPMPLLHSGIQEVYGIWLDADGVAWATGADTVLYRWDPASAGDPDRNFQVLTRRVQVNGKTENWYGGAGKLSSAKLSFRDNGLRFEFAAPFYEEPSAVEYQVRLDGSDRDWTSWTHETTKDYTNLSEGSYRFHVRARSPHGTVAEDAALAFGILPPWYRTWWAYTLYAIFGGFGVWGIVRWRTSQLEEDKRKLEGIVEERTVEVRQQRDEIRVQEQKSQALLLNILPSKVADELKSTGAVQPVAFDDVTVCFTDFVGFTVSSEKMAPGNLVNALNEYFTRFDEIIARYQLEKLKTIGDSYMFVSGLPAQRGAHAVDAVMAALEMVEVVKELGARAGGTGWNIRVGLHSGPVVAGVVGIRKFAFDIWGNTVNFAARMESSGVPGRVNMSERTCRQLRGLIECESRGAVKIKEGRELPMFLAEGVARQLVYGDVVNGMPGAFAARYREEFGEEPRSFGGVQAARPLVAAAGD
ncbi:MAG TPA: adenylate/guanylate cyclase domain-containing protein [Bryobacteraceae bacterium]|nr:adenylate/guanylate cyclase domain-containing protein [Bryobacteraceae bacterium]